MFSVIVPLVTTALIVAVVVWAIRRSMPPREAPAILERKDRFARGEIDTAEYEVRLRALRGQD